MRGRWDPASSPCDADFSFVKVALETLKNFLPIYCFIIVLLLFFIYNLQNDEAREPKGANKACVKDHL